MIGTNSTEAEFWDIELAPDSKFIVTLAYYNEVNSHKKYKILTNRKYYNYDDNDDKDSVNDDDDWMANSLNYLWLLVLLVLPLIMYLLYKK